MADTTRHGRASRRRPLAGQVMYARRMELDWTLEKLGERANGIAIQTVVRVECGLTADRATFNALANALGLDADELRELDRQDRVD